MRKGNQVLILAFALFLLGQVVKAAGTSGGNQQRKSLTDTTKVIDSLRIPENPKKDFQNLFSTAVTGDGVNGAKLNPMAVSFVQSYIGRNQKGFQAMKVWGKPYLDMMDEVLVQHGLPKELKYLAVIESGLKYNAISFAGAVGPWAFMPAAAREYGLKMTPHNDERLDYYKSTHAAARLLTNFYQRYGDWLLVIAAYNCGPGNVDKAIRKSGGGKDFWTLQYNLPNESMNHVKKFIATHYIFEGEGGLTTLTKSETKNLLSTNSHVLNETEMSSSTAYKITGRFASAVIIKHCEVDRATFDRYNPGFDVKIANDGKYELRLPTQKMNVFVGKRYQILEESMQDLLQSTSSTR